jgi:transcriptional regulator with GAF, ATPase, and Fis domain
MPATLAYLVTREGSKWTDVFRLVPGQVVSIGRAPSNRIVLKDERCSRFHAELSCHDDRWMLKDLDSRNGTSVGERFVKGEVPLEPGDIIRVGNTQLAFVNDLSQAFPDNSQLVKTVVGAKGGSPSLTPDPDEISAYEPTTITHRRKETKFLAKSDSDELSVGGAPKEGIVAARLLRLAFELAKAADPTSVAKLAIDGLIEGVPVDAAGVLLMKRDLPKDAKPTELATFAGELEMLASRSTTATPYHRVSPFLAAQVLGTGEAVLARNVLGDSTLGIRDSKGDFNVTSVICAPIRRAKQFYGLIHLYSTQSDRVPDGEDLEFTLTVADTVAVALYNLDQRKELAENLDVVRDENLQLREQLGATSDIVGHSPAITRVKEQIARSAPTNSTVLVYGESGVGKELVARALHFSSPRAKGPFVCLNCAALSESLLESELFGHERGAFTGATGRKMGKFEAANKGTLVLDEIGEMSPTIQAKLLRVLEGHAFERVGGSEPVKVDVRAIAATNRDLEQEVAEGRFRRDLYFRLHVVEIVVPPLRKRPEDITELAKYFFEKFVRETGRKLRGYTQRAIDQMKSYRWPGNVREMKNVIERAIVLAQGEYIDVDDLMLSKLPTSGDTLDTPPVVGSSFSPLSLDEMESRHILATLRATNWNKSQAASFLGIERSTLDRKIKRYNLVEQPRG